MSKIKLSFKQQTVALLLLLTASQYSYADFGFDGCLQQQLQLSDDTVTVGELKAACHQILDEVIPVQPAKEPSAITRRIALEHSQRDNPFTLLPHKPNYIILSNNLASANEQPFNDASLDGDVDFQPLETKFQLSFKVPVIRNLFDNKAALFVAYTNRSFWQQFNGDSSSPFRDSNHEPEIWLSFKNDSEFLGFKNPVIRTGVVHQSNGQGGGLSRSWNRAFVDFIIEKNDWYFSVKPWWRIPESSKKDDNPDIEDYLGYFELGGLYKRGEHSFEFLVRNNVSFNQNRGALQLGWSFPIHKNLRGYLQWFNGYGESLIDYNAYSNSVGVGIQFSDWL